MALYENINGINYRVVYYHIGSKWENGKRFEYYSDSNGHGYKYELNGTLSNFYGFGDKSDYTNTFSEIIGEYTAKVYLPADATTIRFQSNKNLSDGDKQRVKDIALNTNVEGVVETSNNWPWGGGSPQSATIYLKADFMNLFNKVYFQIKSEWNGGMIGGLESCYVYGNSQDGRYCAIRNTIMKKYSNLQWAEYLVPKATTKICLQNSYDATGGAQKCSDETPQDGYLYRVNSNNSGLNRQTEDWIPWVEPPIPTHYASVGIAKTNLYVGSSCVAAQIKTN